MLKASSQYEWDQDQSVPLLSLNKPSLNMVLFDYFLHRYAILYIFTLLSSSYYTVILAEMLILLREARLKVLQIAAAAAICVK